MIAIRYLTKMDGTKMAWIVGGDARRLIKILNAMSNDEIAIFEGFFGF